ncbi:MAG TPA: hypothetical protein VIP46_22620 [Pyrinomonadaceae bacterium]
MSTTATPQRVKLLTGYKGGDGVAHTEVEIGKRITAGDLMRIGDDPESTIEVQFNLLLLSVAITKFGTLPVPPAVPLTVLLSLDSVDREDLSRAHNRFIKASRGGARPERLSESRVRLTSGFQIGGQTYDVVEFGRLLTGYDEIDADGMSQWRQQCFLLGKQITQLAQSAGGATLAGPIDADAFESLPDVDLYELINLSADWKNSFRRRKRAEVQPDGGGGRDVSAAAPAGHDGARSADAQS